MGGLCQAAVRRPATGARLSRPLHPSRGHFQSAPPPPSRRQRHLSMEGLSPQRQRKIPPDDTRLRRVHPPLPAPHVAASLSTHPALWVPGQPPSPPKIGTVPATPLLPGDRTAARVGRLPPGQPSTGPNSSPLPEVCARHPGSRSVLARLSLACTTTGHFMTPHYSSATGDGFRSAAAGTRRVSTRVIAVLRDTSLPTISRLVCPRSHFSRLAPLQPDTTNRSPAGFPSSSPNHSLQPRHSFSITGLYTAV